MSLNRLFRPIAVAFIKITGSTLTPDTTAVTVNLKDSVGDILHCSGTTVPTDTETGFAKGCTFIDTDVAWGTGSVYLNKWTNTSSEFTLVTQAA